MKNLKYYTEDAFEFHKEIIRSKNKTISDPTYKNRLETLNDIVEKRFLLYDHNFYKNTLENINCYKHNNIDKADLLKLYSYKSSIIKNLKTKITTTDTNRIINTCPNCTISEINSFDHYLPKEHFPEFVVNPKNLFPSCTICNSYKNNIWKKENKRIFLNLYLDILPNTQYLFLELDVKKDVISSNFYLKNNGFIPNDIFQIIICHYTNLHLTERFNLNINEIVTSLESTINAFIGKLPLEVIRKSIIEKSNQDKIFFGSNYWKSILEIELVNNTEYMSRFILE